MDTKRLIAALALSLVILFGWSYLFPPDAPQTPPVAAQPESKLEQPTQNAPTAAADATTALAQGRPVMVKTPLFTARFNTQGGVLESFVLAKYRETVEPGSANIDIVGQAARNKAALGLMILPEGGEVHTWNAPGWTYEGGDVELSGNAKQTLVFSGEAAGLKIVRRLTLSADSYLVTEETTITNPGQAPVSGRVAFGVASAGLAPKGDSYNVTRIAFGKVKSGFEEHTDHGDLKETGAASKDPVNWAAIESNYFLFAALPKAEGSLAFGRLKDDVFNLAVSNAATFEPGQSKTVGCSYYVGPADRGILSTMPNKLEEAIDFGWFHIIAVPLLKLLNWFYAYVHNYGVAIILLTVLIKLIFWPLSQKSYKSMEQMKRIQPMIQKLREKHADDKERMNQEIMALYKTYKVNPAGGCLPMIVQIPVFFGLYKALLGSIELRHAAFITHVPFTDLVWLADLSAKDPYYVTPLIMGATMFIQQKMTPTGGDPMQAKIMLLMPVVFTFLFLNFPSGLVVYWLVNNVLSIAQQWWMMRSKA
ncbi:YidC/Oxa1 family membrane protein insertase [Humidesulfovibrio mexicanus]|uniref:Membrane protein insertase YidC n=1 Tax=Humidesulfovibrio mexicanus TaxID=147047 RepID=A0A239BGY6_9BACT|nr:membrane protein insertase YidC [Humidesulfovibrio mexicanus]SNS06949.1 YidC/Oxa1 family membrane protein insertase [Humidesulfovibrio mexicanus]